MVAHIPTTDTDSSPSTRPDSTASTDSTESIKPKAMSRRSLLKRAGRGLLGAGILALSGCVSEDNPAYDAPPPPPLASPIGLGSGPTLQSVTREDADVIVNSVGELVSQIGQADGRVIWIEDGTQIDLTGRNITLRNVTLASNRNEDSSGAALITQDSGVTSPVHDYALVNIVDKGRLTGVTVRGPLHDYTDSPVIPGYVPFAPGRSWGIRERWRNNWYSRGVSIQSSEAQVDNCEIWGWSTGIMVGAKETVASPNILHCYIHNCMLTSAGYPIDVKRGLPTVYRCAFDAYRHALNGFGYADAGYLAVECVFGPHCSSHPIDMHGIHNNARDGGSSDPSNLRYRWRAGGTMLVRNCQIMPTRTIDDSLHNEGRGYVNHNADGITPHVHIRAVPADGFYFEGNACAHPNPEVGIHQSSVPGRYSRNGMGWHNIYLGENQWGVEF